MPLQRRIKLVVLLVLTVSLVGCAASKQLTFYPIQGTDIYTLDNGDTCMSEKYLKEVLEAKIGKF